MEKITIFLNGEYLSEERFYKKNAKNSFIICADGAYNTIKKLGIKPNVIIGDMDSIKQKIQTSTKVIKYPTNKDMTDGEISIDYAMSKNPSQIFIFGASGGRKDQELANIFLLCKYPLINIKILEKNTMMWIAKKKELFSAKKGQIISLIPMSEKVTDITTEGLKFNLNKEILYMNKTRGISNVAKRDKIKITHKKGILLITILK